MEVVKIGVIKKQYITLAINLILIVSVLNGMFYISESISNSVNYSNEIINNSFFSQIKNTSISQNLKNIDGFFTKNQGQVDNESVRYYIQGKGIWFLDDCMIFKILEPIKNNNLEEQLFNPDPLRIFRDNYEKSIERKSIILKLNFEGANRVIPRGQGVLPHCSNFFYSNDSSKWRTNVPNYQEIIYENLYNNIDLKYYTTDLGLKYDFIVHPDGEINDIKLKYENAQELWIDNFGYLNIQTSFKNIKDSNLLIYQNINNEKKVIKGKFKIFNSVTYGFNLFEKYERGKDLIIDPLIYSTFIGGNGDDECFYLAVDSNHSVYATGRTRSLDFPNTIGTHDNNYNGEYDIFVFKLNSNGSSLNYSTYIGGSNDDLVRNIALDSNDCVFIIGGTNSSNFPVTKGAFDNEYNDLLDLFDVFVLKLNKIGSILIYSTYVGGIDDDFGEGITIDAIGNVYATGYTLSLEFPVTSNVYKTNKTSLMDIFVFKLNPVGSKLIYSTFVGGTDGEETPNGFRFLEAGYDIVIDNLGNSYVTGWTNAKDFPNTTGAYDNTYNGGFSDAFIFKLNWNGSALLYSTYIGGYGAEIGFKIKIDPIGNTLITGHTNSSNFPNTTNAYDNIYNGGSHDVFVLKLDSSGSSLIYSTYIGGNDSDWGASILIDTNNNIFITGVTSSHDFPNTTTAFDKIHNGNLDIFILVLNPIGSSILYSSFIGGNGDDFGIGSSIDSNNNLYLTGYTNSIDFPNTTNAFDTSYNGNNDGFVIKFNIYPNNISKVLDLKISDPKVFRTNSIYLFSNASDLNDLEKNLTPFFEYRDPNDQVWNNTYFSDPYYNNSRWEISFTPPKNATLGLYDFKVRFNDTGSLFSNWFYLNNSLTVLNNIPFVENLFLSKHKAILSDNISIWINGSDVEDTEENLTIEFEYRDPNEQSWDTTYLDNPIYSNEKWEYIFNIPFNAPFGYYDFRVRFNDSDKDFSQWLYKNDSLLLSNLKPIVIDIKLSKNYVYRTNFVNIFVNGTDYETPESLLKFYAQYKPEFEDNWIDLIGNYSYSNHRWEIKFITTINSTLGFYDFRVKFIDNESASSGWKYLNDSLEVLNNIPYIDDFCASKSFVFRTEIIVIYTNASDIEDPENLLRCVIQYKSPSDDWTKIKDEFFNIDHWEINFTPSINAELGYYDIRVNFTDMDNGYSGWTIIEDAFEVRNNLPVISNLCDNFEVDFHTKDIDLTQYESDIEDPDKDLIWNIDQTTINTSLFSMNIIDVSEDKIQIIPKNNVSGSDDITLILTDKDKGLAIKSNVTINVNSVISYYYNINITVSPNSVDIIQGQSLNVTLIVTNIGNLSDNYTILFKSNEFTTQDIQIEKGLVYLISGEFKNVNVTITIPKDMKIDTYNIIFIARSNFAIDNTTLTINVKAKDTGTKDNTILFVSILIIIIIVIIILILLFLFILKKKPKNEKEMMETKTQISDAPPLKK